MDSLRNEEGMPRRTPAKKSGEAISALVQISGSEI